MVEEFDKLTNYEIVEDEGTQIFMRGYDKMIFKKLIN